MGAMRDAFEKLPAAVADTPLGKTVLNSLINSARAEQRRREQRKKQNKLRQAGR